MVTDSGERPPDGDRPSGSPVQRALRRVLAEGGDVQYVPARLCQVCVDQLPVTGASISLNGDGTSRMVWWSSDEVAGRLAEAQYSLGDGPCQRAVDLAAPVLASDLSAGPDARRWPVFAGQAVAMGVRAVFSLPLGVEAQVLGTLDLYRDVPGEMAVGDLSSALLAADAIMFALVNLQASAVPDGSASWLKGAEANRDEVQQATGMIMFYLDVEPQQALARLRAHAFVHGQSVSEAAHDVIDRKVTFDA
ncbi:GAF and ANTAR domain-containing protein [Streptomyces sp. NPDC054863]